MNMTSLPTGSAEGMDPAVARADAEALDSEVATPFRQPERSRVKKVLWAITPPIATFFLFIATWYLIRNLLLSEQRRFILPAPTEVISAGFTDTAELSKILEAMWATGKVALVGLVISIVLGVGFAVLMSQGRWIERSLYPYAVIVQTIPILALVPLIGIWFDRSERARVIACVLIAVFPIITNTLFGLKSAEKQLHELFTLHSAGRWTRLRKLQFPAALPAIFTGLRIAAGGCVIGAIVGDFFFRQGALGIGRYIDVAQKQNQIPELFAAALISSIFGVTIFVLFGWLGNRVVRHWHDSANPM